MAGDHNSEPTHFIRELVRKALIPICLKLNIKPETLMGFRFLFALVTLVAMMLSIVLSIASKIWLPLFIAYQFVFLLDYIDGRLAKIKGVFDPKLQKLDRAAHTFFSALFLSAITLIYCNQIINPGLYENTVIGIGLVASIGIVLKIHLEKPVGIDKVKKDSEVKGKNFIWYNFLRIDGAFTLFFFLVLFKLYALAILILGSINILITIRKIRKYALKN